jgi:hypothetical protein
MTIQSGNVGIGTSDPTQKLEVNGNVFIPAGSSYWIGNAADAGNRLRLHQTGSNAYIDWGEETLFFRSGVGAATNKVVFTGDGKVGIGTTTPRAGLDLGLGISNRKLILYTTADNDHQFTGLGVNVDAMRYQIANTSANHKFYAATSSTTSTELFRIQGNGQIVIPALTTQGIVQNSTTGVLSSTKGTANQVLKMNSGGTATEWASESDPTVPQGTQAGQMQYWNGTNWVTVAAGQNGQILKFRDGMPIWEDDNIINLSIGDYYQGGVIAYFLQSGDSGYDPDVRHGIIAAPEDQSTGISWGCEGTSIPQVNGKKAIGLGELNTTLITMICTSPDIAAKLCRDLSLNGYDDWFLPSADEMKQIALNKNFVPNIVVNGVYWTSTEYTDNEAYVTQIASPNGYYGGSKSYNLRVRAIRYF